MPVWTPGSYLVREFARNVLDVEATDGSGAAAPPLRRTSKNSWVVSLGGADSLVVDLQRLRVRLRRRNTSYLDTDHAVINGASVFLYARGHRRRTRSRSRSSPTPAGRSSRRASSRWCRERWTFARRELRRPGRLADRGGQPARALLRGRWGRCTRSRSSPPKPIDEERLRRGPQEDRRGTPSRSTGRSRTEVRLPRRLHRRGIRRPRAPEQHPLHRQLLHDGAAVGVQEAAHALQPRVLPHLERQEDEAHRRSGPSTTRARTTRSRCGSPEGVTSYYEDVILRRAGHLLRPGVPRRCSPTTINEVKSLPSSRWQTPEESSFDTWISFYRPDENTPNVSPSYYRQGAVARHRSSTSRSGGRPAARRRSTTRCGSSTAETYKQGRGFTDEEFERACSEASGGTTDEVFTRYVRGRERVRLRQVPRLRGAQARPPSRPRRSRRGSSESRSGGPGAHGGQTRLFGSPGGGSPTSPPATRSSPWTGSGWTGRGCRSTSPTRKPGTEVEVTSAREGVLRETKVRLAPRPPFEFRIQKSETATRRGEGSSSASWALADWDAPLEYEDHRVSPARSRKLDYV